MNDDLRLSPLEKVFLYRKGAKTLKSAKKCDNWYWVLVFGYWFLGIGVF
jgi:hypothetical protein